MTLSNVRASFGLNGRANPSKAGTVGTVQVGGNNETISLTGATKIVSFDAVIAGSGSDLVIDVSDLDATGSTAWTAGTAQRETATAAGTISGSGNAEVIVTASGMTGSPKTIAVAVLASDTAATWAGKVRAALAADAAVSELFAVSGTTTAIILTRKPTKSYTVNGTTVNLYAANDGTLNIALNNGTCTGITPAASSANTTAGVLTVGVYAPDLDGTDFEGVVTGGLASYSAMLVENDAGSTSSIDINATDVANTTVTASGALLYYSGTVGGSSADITISSADNAKITVTLAG
jgi:hypothetical protein